MTIRLGIIGWPLIKTFSPNIHQTLSEISNVDITYKKLPIENFTLDIFESLNNNFDGYNITIPHKENIYNCLLYTSPSPRDGLLSRMPSSA